MPYVIQRGSVQQRIHATRSHLYWMASFLFGVAAILAFVRPSSTYGASIWGSTVTPATPSTPSSYSYEPGVKFRSDVNGTITAIRFYKGPGNTGTHIGYLWTRTGKLLASATFTSKTASGWQQVNLPTPVPIAANTTYVASYWDPGGHYSISPSYFTTAYNNPPLHALANGTDGPNGVFCPGANAFPTQGYQATNYWVDVVFVPAASVIPATTQTLTASPTTLSYGSVLLDLKSSKTITLTNTGTASVTASQATVTGTGFSISALSLPLTLAAGQSASFSAIFAPLVAGNATGSISVVSNASNSPATITLSGVGSTQMLSASPASLGFGNVTIGSNSTLPVVVTNPGSASVTISQATTTGAGFSTRGPSLPLILAAGKNISFSVTFSPTTAGPVAGQLSVVSNATNSPTVASLSGAGVNKHTVTLSWLPSTSTGVVDYNVYRGTVAGGPYEKLNSSPITVTLYTDPTVLAGQTYYYVTTALDSESVESAYSNQAEAAVPFP